MLMVTGVALLFTRHLSSPSSLSCTLINNVCTHCRRGAAEPAGTQGCHGPTCTYGSRGSYRTCWLDCVASVPLQTGCNCNLPYRYDLFDCTAIHRFFICNVEWSVIPTTTDAVDATMRIANDVYILLETMLTTV
jgi:hypothetical protein